MSEITHKKRPIRVKIKQLTSIIPSGGDYELVQGVDKATPVTIHIINISSGGLCIESKNGIKKGVSFDLEIPKVANLDSQTVTCEVTRSTFMEDPLIHINFGTNKDKSYYEIGSKFKVPNTDYLKQLLKLAKENVI